MGKAKSERHHWWPRGVSQRWADEAGGVNWLLPDGEVRRMKPAALGVIGNGHFIKLGNNPEEPTPWDQNFETEFHNADDRFPAIIEWLEGLDYQRRSEQAMWRRFVPQHSTEAEFGQMIESLTSLAIRSPMNREACVSLAERLRGPLPERERNRLIAVNMRDMYRRAVNSYGVRGKATAILSPDREFIFGDGFYSNPSTTLPRFLVPLTPRLAVLYARPAQYGINPRLSTLVLHAHEAETLNEVVQVYARTMVFYRSEKPTLTDDFRCAVHRELRGFDNPVETLVRSMPGVSPRDTSLDFLNAIASRS